MRSKMGFEPKSEFMRIMVERGFVQDSTDLTKLDSFFSSEKVVAYIGYDATAKSLHVGHLVPIMMLRWLQKCGHQPITLMGGGTTKVGDPSFRSEDRPLLEDQEISDNIQSLKSVFTQYIQYKDLKNKAIMVNNSEWLDKINYLDFLESVNQPNLTFDGVEKIAKYIIPHKKLLFTLIGLLLLNKFFLR